VFSEDTAALVGLVLAATGLVLHQLTDQAFWDSAAAIAIGVLLAVVAYLLGRDTKELLIGEAAAAPVRDGIRDALAGYEGVEAVVEVRTMLVGPDALLVAARLDLADHLPAGEVERSTDRMADDLRRRFPEIREVYLDLTSGRDRQVAARAPDPTSASTTPPSTIR